MKTRPVIGHFLKLQPLKPGSYLDGKAEANRNLRKDRSSKRNVSPTTAISDWFPLSAFPSRCELGLRTTFMEAL